MRYNPSNKSRLFKLVAARFLKRTLKLLTLGISAQQWTACVLICALLSLSVAAPVGVSMPRVVNNDSINYEPVNEDISVFTSTFRELNAEIEATLTPWRSVNWSLSDDANADDKTKKAPVTDDKPASDEDKNKPSTEPEKNNIESSEHLPDRPPTEPAISQPMSTLVAPPLDDDEFRSSFRAENNLGSPMGQVDAQAPNSPAALGRNSFKERIGSANFNFEVPVASLPGRGIDAGISLSYNSRLWTRTVPLSDVPRYRYNLDGDWLAPGFKLTLGSLKYQNYYNLSLTSPDGTRHQLSYVSGDNYARSYESTDGTFVRADVTTMSGTNGTYLNDTVAVRYSDGSSATYTSFDLWTNRHNFFPTKITDRNGNTIYIVYRPNDTSGRISYIRDTLNRSINFYYDAGNKLVGVTVPGFNGGGERQTVRFYYETMNFDTTTSRFQNANHTIPTTADVLKFVYFPGTNTGYKYEYSPAWGMIYKITDLRGMQVSDPTSLTQTGTITNEGQAAATTQYNYPLTLGAPLTDVPRFTARTDDWAGRTTAQPSVTNYQVETDTTINRTKSKITSPDGTITETWANIAPNGWDDGLVTDTFTKTLISVQFQTYKIWEHSKLFWGNQAGVGGRQNPRLLKVEQTNDANQTRATIFEYDSYNNQTLVKEHDFAAPDSLGTELRKTETTYQTGAGWINNRLFSLPTLVKTTVNSTVVSKTAYEYDNNGGSASGNLLERNDIDIQTHDPRFNWNDGGYDPTTDYRGNLTKITAFSDATLETDTNAVVTTMKCDIAGNTVESGASCCKEKEWIYDKVNEYAYPVTEKRGDNGQLQTSVTYDRSTGLVKTATDENGQESTVTYSATNLRVIGTNSPNGATTATEYNDSVFPYHVKTTASLDSTRSVLSWSFTNGAGQQFRTRGQTADGYVSSDVEFDNMGRALKSFNPYTIANLTDVRPANTKFSEITQRDGLGRTLQTTLPDLTTVSATYNGLVATATDQAGKSRRQLADALGRTVRVDEPDSYGNLGDLNSPLQPTYYEYDGNDNLTKVTQTETGGPTQERRFKFDALSRLIAEKQVEADATLDINGVKGSLDPVNKFTKVLKYNNEGQLIDGYDARGVRTQFAYDGLNRVLGVTYSGEVGYQTPAVTYTYDQARSGFFNNGALTKVETAAVGETPSTKTEFDYDLVGRIRKHRQWIGSQQYDLEYEYNLAGQSVSEKYPSGRIVTNSYDANGRLSALADATRTYISGLQYQGLGGSLSAITLGNGIVESLQYNDRGQMKQMAWTKNNSVIQRYDYSFGQINPADNTVDATKNNGQLAQIESYIGGTPSSPTKQFTQKFIYDSIGRLERETEYHGDNNTQVYSQKFSFDRFGNRYLKASENPSSQNPLLPTFIEDGNVHKGTNRFASNTNTVYDEAGQVKTDNKFRSLKYSYDANGRMIKSSTTTDTNVNLAVMDAAGNKVAEKVNDIWRFAIYDAFGKMIAEYGGLNQADDGGVKFVHQDIQGSTRTITRLTGNVIARIDYQAFGEQIPNTIGQRTVQGFAINDSLRQRYALTERDDATGLDDTWWRKHENRAGRWTRPDPYLGSLDIGDPQSFNRYSYAANEPTNYIDPSGLAWVLTCVYIGYMADAPGFPRVYNCKWTKVEGSGGGGPHGNPKPDTRGGGGHARPQQQPEKKKCKQDKNGGDANAIKDAQEKAGIADKIGEQEQSQNSPEGLIGYTTDRQGLLAILASNKAILYDTGMGGLHPEVGKKNVDSRSRKWSGQGLGRDSRGMSSSLQVVVGETDPVTGRAKVYSDLDCVNPAEGALPAALHGAPIVVKRIGRGLKRIFGF